MYIYDCTFMETNNSAHSTPKKIKTPKLFIKKKRKNPKVKYKLYWSQLAQYFPISFTSSTVSKPMVEGNNIYAMWIVHDAQPVSVKNAIYAETMLEK